MTGWTDRCCGSFASMISADVGISCVTKWQTRADCCPVPNVLQCSGGAIVLGRYGSLTPLSTHVVGRPVAIERRITHRHQFTYIPGVVPCTVVRAGDRVFTDVVLIIVCWSVSCGCGTFDRCFTLVMFRNPRANPAKKIIVSGGFPASISIRVPCAVSRTDNWGGTNLAFSQLNGAKPPLWGFQAHHNLVFRYVAVFINVSSADIVIF
jgi:hypothetical protein